MTDHTCWRADRGPQPPPPGTGEWAKVATSTGPRSWASRHRSATPAAGPVSTLTCTEAVEVEEGLHGGVAGLVEDPPRGAEGVEPPGDGFEGHGPQRRGQGGEVGGGGRQGRGQAPPGRGAHL